MPSACRGRITKCAMVGILRRWRAVGNDGERSPDRMARVLRDGDGERQSGDRVWKDGDRVW